MNEYKVCFSMFQIMDNKISPKNHFSNCVATIKGETFDDALNKFKAQKKSEGWYVDFAFEGDGVANVTFFDLKTGKIISR